MRTWRIFEVGLAHEAARHIRRRQIAWLLIGVGVGLTAAWLGR